MMFWAKIKLAAAVVAGVAAVGAVAAKHLGAAEPPGPPAQAALPLGDEATPEQQDRTEPFCYFLKPSDEIGFKDCPEGTQVTWDGAFCTGFGEFDLYAGRPLKPVNKRVKTLLNGYLPIVEYAFTRDGVVYSVQAFAAPVDLDSRNNLINFVRVTVRNPGKERAEAAVGVVFADWHGGGREASREGWWTAKFADEKAFAASREVRVADGRAWRGGHLVFAYGQESAEVPTAGLLDEMLAAPVVGYKFELAPGGSRAVEFKVPYVPVAVERAAEVEAVVKADYDDYLKKTEDFLEGVLAAGAKFIVPEKKVVDTMKACLSYDLIARDVSPDGKVFVQKVSEVHYDGFYSRDSAFIANSYDLLGQHKIAEETIDYFVLRGPDGMARGFRETGPDSWGQPLWAVAAHCRITGDAEFARKVHPALAPHVERFKQACAKDELGLWPKAGPYDNEALKNGHYTGHSFWALLGLRGAVALARAAGKEEEAAAYQRVHDEYRERFLAQLEEVTDQTGGYMPPGVDDPMDGNDWDNASAGVYPFGVLPPDDPLVKATLETVRDYMYREGIMTYGPNAWTVKTRIGSDFSKLRGGSLHHYDTMQVTPSLLACGEQRKVLEDFYSILVHTGSTHAGFEFGIGAWGSRDPGGNLPPHGWFAARYNGLLRNMLVREGEDGRTLHLASALSPAWLKAGDRIVVERAPTDFGPVSYTVASKEDGAEVSIAAKWRTPPERFLFHIPWFLKVTAASIDGAAVQVKDEAVTLPPGAKTLALKWEWAEKPDLSYETGVNLYVEKYWKIQEKQAPPDTDYRTIFPKRP